MSTSQKGRPASDGTVAIACILFVVFSIPSVLTSILSGVMGSSGLMNVEPKVTDYIPLVGLIVGALLLGFGATKTIPQIYMWLASPLVFIVFIAGTLLV